MTSRLVAPYPERRRSMRHNYARALRRMSLAGLVAVTTAAGLAGPGQLDPTFGNGGVALTRFQTPLDPENFVQAFVVQADGRVVVAGIADGDTDHQAGVVRWRRDGVLDGGFGTGGKVESRFGVNAFDASALVALPDGRLVLGGSTGTFTAADCYVARLLPHGELDQSFGAAGVEALTLGPSCSVLDLARQPDGKILLLAYLPSLTSPNTSIARLLPDGGLDPTFGVGGVAVISPASVSAARIAVQPDGRILVAAGTHEPVGTASKFTVLRLTPVGAPDPTFGQNGVVGVAFGRTIEGAADVAMLASGRILAVGTTRDSNVPGTFQAGFSIARLLADGSLDSSFGGGDGRVTTTFSSPVLGPHLALVRDGRFVVAGTASVNNFALAVARYRPSGQLDTTFSSNGKALTVAGLDGAETADVAVLSNGKIVIGGTGSVAGALYFLAVRFKS